MSQVTINFDNDAAAKHFLSWLCGAGEQDYWTWMECREDEMEGNITATRFKYDFDNHTADTECGRLGQ